MKFPTGLRLSAKVNNITKLGIFATLPHHHHGLTFHKNLGDKQESVRNRCSIGDEIRVVIINNREGEFLLSLNQTNNPDLINPTNKFRDNKDFTPLAKLVESSTRKVVDLRNSAGLSDQ